MAVVEKTVDIIGDEALSALILGRNIPEGFPVDLYDDAVRKLRSYGLYGTSGMQSVNFTNVTEVAGYAFAYCPDLKKVSLPNCKSFTGSYIFRSDANLEEVELPALESVYASSFSGCSKLTSVSLPKLVNCGNGLFASMNGLVSVSVPRLKSTGSYAFNASRAIKQIDLPSVTYIGDIAMSYCSSLEVVNIGPNITRIHATAFANTPAGVVINLPVAEGVLENAPWGATEAVIKYEVPYSGDVPIPEY